MKQKILYTLAIITVTLGFLLGIYAWYMTLYPFDVIDNERIELQQTKVHQGETLDIIVHFDKNYNFNATAITYYFVDGVILRIPQDGFSRQLGNNAFTRRIVIPKDLIKGEYKIRLEWAYEIFPLRQPQRYFAESEIFEVVE